MNSLRSLQRALAFEIERQSALLAAGQEVEQETRHWDEAAGCTRAGRSKEESSDYRYFPEPDLVPVELDASRLGRLRAAEDLLRSCQQPGRCGQQSSRRRCQGG